MPVTMYLCRVWRGYFVWRWDFCTVQHVSEYQVSDYLCNFGFCQFRDLGLFVLIGWVLVLSLSNLGYLGHLCVHGVAVCLVLYDSRCVAIYRTMPVVV